MYLSVYTDFHGTSGPIHIEDTQVRPYGRVLGEAFIKAGEELGFKSLDYNGADNEGKLCVG